MPTRAANINRFCVARLLFERLASGAVVPSVTIRTLHLLWYDSARGIPLQLVAEGGLLLLVFFFIVLECRAMYRQVEAWIDRTQAQAAPTYPSVLA